MQIKFKKLLLSALMTLPIASYSQAGIEHIPTRIGQLSYQTDYPTDETVHKLRDEMIFQSAVQTYLWSIPLATVISMRDGLREAGGTNTSIPITENFLTSKQIVPTGNQATVYAYNVTTLSDEPMVLEIAPNTLGFIADAWQRPIKDVGFVGPDKGKGGKYIIVPPGYQGELPSAPDGTWVYRSPTKNIWWLQRGFAVNGDSEPAIKTLKTSRVYALSQADNPPKQHFMNLSEHPYMGMPDQGFAYWEAIAKAIQEEPVAERDRSMMALVANIGIEKGKPFAPDTHTKEILIEAAKVAEGMLKTLSFATNKQEAKIYPDRQWEYVYLTESPYFEGSDHTQVYERAAFTYQAMTGAVAMLWKLVGKGSQYATTVKDSEGNYLDGGQNYKLTVPANVPANNYWSIAVYDVQTRSLIDNGTPKSTLGSNRPELKQNADGTTDLYFGPTAPAGMESNWVKTVPGKGIFAYARYYGPEAAYFDKSWKPNDFQLVK